MTRGLHLHRSWFVCKGLQISLMVMVVVVVVEVFYAHIFRSSFSAPLYDLLLVLLLPPVSSTADF